MYNNIAQQSYLCLGNREYDYDDESSYHDVNSEHWVTEGRHGRDQVLPTLWPLAAACRKTYHEAIGVLYRHLVVNIDIAPRMSLSADTATRLAASALLTHVRDLHISTPVRSDSSNTFERIFGMFDWGFNLKVLTINWFLGVTHGDFAGEHFMTALYPKFKPFTAGRKLQDWEDERIAVKERLSDAWMKLKIKQKVSIECGWNDGEDTEFVGIIKEADKQRIQQLGLSEDPDDQSTFLLKLTVEDWV
ncbi:hypothetical protein C1H76_7522 [Elsinoe australis]|uniref:Uncharacterized protein n=1 Tax=Elsinoe australis TaxID=40998 RepID=A0A4U7AQU0_9PEZI|nr:hypothetical protein C1H76_7522 [Elsinoe australis]